MPTDEHNRICQYANSAMESLLAKQQHVERCLQCRTDPSFCPTSGEYDRSFRRDYERWLANRESGGIVSRGAAMLGPSIVRNGGAS